MRKVILLCCFCPFFGYSQFEGFQNDLDAVTQDLIFLTEKYISPAADASVYQASGGWYTNFTPKSKFDVEISLQYNLLFIPNSKKNFIVNESELQNLGIQGTATSAQIPTALGGDNFVVLEGRIGEETFEFDSPEGIGQETVKHGQIQATVGLWKQTNLIVRYAPNIKINETKYSSFGFGLAHHLNQWIKPLMESSYHFGLLMTYTNYYVEDEFNEADLILGTINAIKVKGNSIGFNLVASKSVKQFDFSTAIGLASTKFNYEVGGSNKQDFIDVLGYLNDSLGSLEGTETNVKFDLNVNYRIKDFSLNTMLTLGQYANLNMGVSYNIN
ncbi:hypothetical protein C1T31_07895 [Hanstruepera neustonica]|uniref:Uncharacterized protein n=1 Tax=Hanstruepera neustonica TaxID=1445657 RepID=A0A2K1DZK6_9FLAO|nr:DUF6588 family protein [Hanstruepera neustonica]PNQ73424.1 hypothetical protein C1T31_07895 [Hanstruepera neustonica]